MSRWASLPFRISKSTERGRQKGSWQHKVHKHLRGSFGSYNLMCSGSAGGHQAQKLLFKAPSRSSSKHCPPLPMDIQVQSQSWGRNRCVQKVAPEDLIWSWDLSLLISLQGYQPGARAPSEIPPILESKATSCLCFSDLPLQ